MIRAYVPWYLVRNYLAFAFVACLAALQLAEARDRRYRLAALFALIAAFLGFYALAPELLTPGPAGGEMTFLFGGAALMAVIVTRVLSRITRPGHSEPPQSDGEESLSYRMGALRRSATRSDTGMPLRVEFRYLIFPLASLIISLFDVPLFHLLNGLALRTPLIDVPAQFLMNDYIAPTALVAVLLAMWFAGQTADERLNLQRTVLRALIALALASITLKLINEVYFRPRPFAFDNSVRLLFYHPSDSTMPSNAAAICFVLAVAVWLRQRQWGRVMLIIGVGMTLARVVGGVHYPADIVAGAWLGGIWAGLVNRILWLDRPLDAVTHVAHHTGLA